MIDRVVEIAVNSLIKNDLLQKSEIELYRFGIKRILLFCINVITTIIIGIICNMLWQSVIFSIAYIPLRRYAGGYHAKTPQKCYLLSVLLILGVLTFICGIPKNELLIIIIALAAGIIVFVNSPVESKNKELSEKEREAFKRYSRIILLTELAVMLATLLINVEFAMCLCLSIVSSAIMVVIPERTVTDKQDS